MLSNTVLTMVSVSFLATFEIFEPSSPNSAFVIVVPPSGSHPMSDARALQRRRSDQGPRAHDAFENVNHRGELGTMVPAPTVPPPGRPQESRGATAPPGRPERRGVGGPFEAPDVINP